MIDSHNRELSAKLYRWFERHEKPKKMGVDEAGQYFQAAWAELDDILQEHTASPWAMRLVIGYYEALEEVYKQTVQNMP